MSHARLTIGLASALALGACAVQPPTGPRVMALPPPGKDFAAFQNDDMTCRQYASSVSGGTAGAQAGTANALGTAAAATAVGAGLGAAAGSLTAQAGTGAAIGGILGGLVGASAGASSANQSQASLQQQYDTAYTQCMYARGDSVQSPPGGYYAGGPGPYPAYGPAIVGGPTVVVGGWGWGHPYYGHPYYGGGYWHRY